MGKPQKPEPRDNAKEITDAAGIASGLFDSRTGQLTDATTASLQKYLSALQTGKAGETKANKQLLKKLAPELKKANTQVQTAARTSTAPTALGGQLDRSASAALADPTYGNPLLGTLQQQSAAGLADNGQLNPEETRLATQGSRAAYAARGLGTSAPSALSEVLGRQQYVTGRQDRARAFATSTSGLTQDAINSGRNFGTAVNVQDIGKQAQDYSINRDAAGFRVSSSPGMIAYQTPSMAPTALSAAAGTTQQADVFPQTLNYSAGVNDFNANADWSEYLRKINLYYASKYGGMGATAGGAGGGGGFNTGGALTGALGGAATGAAVGSVVPGIGTAVGAVAGGLIGGLGGGLS